MIPAVRLLVATDASVMLADPRDGTVGPTDGLASRRPSTLAWDPHSPERAWCGSTEDGVFRSDDRGESWRPAGLQGERIMVLAPSPVREGLVWAGTEPSAVWRTEDGGKSWERTAELGRLPSSGDWSFPPRPSTHHVRWIACHPGESERIWVAIEAGALVRSQDGGGTWEDRVPGGPLDTHEVAIHPSRPEHLRVAAGDGYFESRDGGSTWETPIRDMDVPYLRSVAVDPAEPDVVVVSGASGPRTAYMAGRSDGRILHRKGSEDWRRVGEEEGGNGRSIAPLLRSGTNEGGLWAVDEWGVLFCSGGGARWKRKVRFRTIPRHVRAFAVQAHM